jgi:hypothetical protein
MASFHFSLFTTTWGICFSLKSQPQSSKQIGFWHSFGTAGLANSRDETRQETQDAVSKVRRHISRDPNLRQIMGRTQWKIERGPGQAANLGRTGSWDILLKT